MLSTKNVESKIELDMSHFLLTLFNLDTTMEFNLLHLHEPIIIVLNTFLFICCSQVISLLITFTKKMDGLLKPNEVFLFIKVYNIYFPIENKYWPARKEIN